MKCPKCGSKIKENKDRDVVWDRGRTAFCNKCHIEYRIDDETNDIIYTEPTTAEKLLWLAENFNVNIQDDSGIEVTIEDRKNGRWADYFVGNEYESKTLAEAINAAYEWAIKDEI